MELVIPEARQDSLFSPQWRNVSIGAVGLCSMLAFEAIGVAAGMPAVAVALDGMALYALAFGSTLAGSVVAMVWAGIDCDRRGPYRSMACGMLMFALGLLLAGLAGSMGVLVLGRCIQGLGVGALGVALYVAAARALPPALHPRLFALFSSAWVVPAVVGPAVSGWIVAQFGWRWLFLGVLLILIPTAVLILPPLRDARECPSRASDRGKSLPWSMLAALGCIALSLAAQAGAWAPVVVVVSVSVLLLSAARLLPAGALRLARGLPTVVALRGLGSAAFFLCEAFIPLWLQQQRGWSITAAGLALTSGALSWSIGSHLQSRIADPSRRQAWLVHGCRMLCAGIVVCALSVLGVLPDWVMLLGWGFSGLGVGLSLPMLGVLTLKLAPQGEQGVYASALQLSAALGTSASLAIGGAAFSLLQGRWSTAAFVVVFAFAAMLAATAWRAAPRVSH